MGLLSFFSKNKSNAWVNCRVANIENLTRDFKVFSLMPQEENKPMVFIPGQYITIEQTIQGEVLRRSYSICGEHQNRIQIGVKKISNGRMSTYLHDEIVEGSELKVHVPEGNFTLGAEKKVCAFVAGSGITPLASMIQSYQSNINLRVFFSVRKKEDVLFSNLLNQTHATVYLSQEEASGFKTGRLTYDALVDEIKTDLSLLQSDVFLLCGPNGFMDEIERCLRFFGVDEGKIKREFFIPPTPKEAVQPKKFSGTCEVVVTIDGQEKKLQIESGKKTLLEHFEEARIDPPYSCRGGVCSSCKAKINEGEVTMRQNYTLTDKEIAQGYILTCQAEPVSNKIVISFDE